MKQMYHGSEGKSLAVCRSMSVAVVLGGLCTIASAQTPTFNPQAFTEQYCVACHDDTSRVAGVSFESVDWKNPGKSGELLEKAIRKVSTGEMPPPDMPHPTPWRRRCFTGWLVDSLDQYAAAHPNPGRPAVHRLNRAEYSNAIRDLLALDTKPGALLPVDDSGYGFDNVARRAVLFARAARALPLGGAPRGGGRGGRHESEARRRRIPESDEEGDRSRERRSAFRFGRRHVDRLLLPARRRVSNPREDAGREWRRRTKCAYPSRRDLRTLGATFPKESFKARSGPTLAAAAARLARAAEQWRGGRGVAPPLPPAQLDLRLDGARVKVFEPMGGVPQRVDRIVITGSLIRRPDAATRRAVNAFSSAVLRRRRKNRRAPTPFSRSWRDAPFAVRVTDADIKPLMAFYQTRPRAKAISTTASRRR